MKKFILTSILITLSTVLFTANAQTSNDPQLPENISDYNTKKPVVVQTHASNQKVYIVDQKQLMSYFIDHSIPSDFPKYDYSLTKKENLGLIKQWLETPGNQELLSDEGKAKVAELKEKNNQ